ncbi:MAG: redoxin domain-containing protein [bacterium]
MALEAGNKAPDFSLPPSNDPEERVTLEETKGFKFVLLFFPLAFTEVCTEEACTINEDLTEYRRKLKTEIMGVSVDSPFALEAWKEQEGFDLPMLSDFNREMIEDYDVKRDELLGLKEVANRAAFVIDGDGIIQYSWETDDPGQIPPFNEIRNTVESL